MVVVLINVVEVVLAVAFAFSLRSVTCISR
jgi:hypothetical protein